jgi:hypothetical protein
VTSVPQNSKKIPKKIPTQQPDEKGEDNTAQETQPGDPQGEKRHGEGAKSGVGIDVFQNLEVQQRVDGVDDQERQKVEGYRDKQAPFDSEARSVDQVSENQRRPQMKKVKQTLTGEDRGQNIKVIGGQQRPRPLLITQQKTRRQTGESEVHEQRSEKIHCLLHEVRNEIFAVRFHNSLSY